MISCNAMQCLWLYGSVVQWSFDCIVILWRIAYLVIGLMKIREVVTCVRFRDFSIFLNDAVVFVLLCRCFFRRSSQKYWRRVHHFLSFAILVRWFVIGSLPNSFGGYYTSTSFFAAWILASIPISRFNFAFFLLYSLTRSLDRFVHLLPQKLCLYFACSPILSFGVWRWKLFV